MQIVHLNYAFFKIMQMPFFVKHFAFYSVLLFFVFQAGIQQWQASISSLLEGAFKYLPFNLIFNAVLECMYLINIQPEIMIEAYFSMFEIINVPMLSQKVVPRCRQAPICSVISSIWVGCWFLLEIVCPSVVISFSSAFSDKETVPYPVWK